jgi:hypothetical protein
VALTQRTNSGLFDGRFDMMDDARLTPLHCAMRYVAMRPGCVARVPEIPLEP